MDIRPGGLLSAWFEGLEVGRSNAGYSRSADLVIMCDDYTQSADRMIPEIAS
jgi:hypothetical protein